MIALLAATVLAAGLSFDAQPLQGIQVAPPSGFLGRPETNFIHADLNRNGHADLLTPTAVYRQQDGIYTDASREPYPSWDGTGAVDVWNSDLYVRTAGGLTVYRWTSSGWATRLDQALEWTGPAAPRLPVPGLDAGQQVRFERFLHDLDDDGVPEIVIMSQHGLAVYKRNGEGYALQQTRALLPPPELRMTSQVTLWPTAERRHTMPSWEQAARIHVDGQTAHVLVRERITASEVRYRHRSLTLADADDPVSGGETWTEALPAFLRPVRLNEDGPPAYAGFQWESRTTHVLAPPYFAYWISLDQGETLRTFRTAVPPGWRPRGPAIDWNGDGRRDLVVEQTHLYDGGLRESLARMMTRSAVDHTISVYRQTEGGFGRAPEAAKRVTLALDKPPFRGGLQFERYRNGRLVSLQGDFDGDGWRDLLVRETPTTVAVYLTREGRFPDRPDLRIDLFADEDFAIADVNGNGRSDIVLTAPAGRDSATGDTVRVLFAGNGGAP